MQYIMAGRHNSLPVCHVEGNGFKWFQKGVLTGLDGLQSEMCKVQMHLFFFYHKYVKTLKWWEQLPPSVTHVYIAVCEFKANDAKGRVRFITNVHSDTPPGFCSLAYILIGIQSALQADCIAGMASAAARSHGILSPDPDSHYLCYTNTALFLNFALASNSTSE